MNVLPYYRNYYSLPQYRPYYNCAYPNYYNYPGQVYQTPYFFPHTLFTTIIPPPQVTENQQLYQSYEKQVTNTKPEAKNKIEELPIIKEEGGDEAQKLVNSVRETLEPTYTSGGNHRWWKISKDSEEVGGNHSGANRNNSGANNNHLEAISYVISINKTEDNVENTTGSPTAAKYKEIIVYKQEDDNISNQPESEQILHLINNKYSKILNNSGEKAVEIKLPDKKESKPVVEEKAVENEKLQTIEVVRKRAQEDKKTKENTKSVINYHCKEIISKFAINETSNEYITSSLMDKNTYYYDLGKNLNTTMHFIMKEIHSIDAPVNFLSMKLTPRQKQNIAILIIDEINSLNVPDNLWAPVCRMVIRVLNDNFKDYFKQKEKRHSKKENNSWLWMVEFANTIQ